MKSLKKYSTFILTFIILVLHAVGLYFFLNENLKDDLLPLTPIHLMITTFILWLSFFNFSLRFIGYSVLIYATGMTVEIIGVNTGYLFGDYKYLEALGTQFMGVPYVIGLNWMMLVFSAGAIVFQLKINWFIKGILGALLMVILDVLIEQVAPKLSFWTFDGAIPIFNYITWFLVALPLFWVGFKWSVIKKSDTAVNIYLILFVFFLVLNLGL